MPDVFLKHRVCLHIVEPLDFKILDGCRCPFSFMHRSSVSSGCPFCLDLLYGIGRTVEWFSFYFSYPFYSVVDGVFILPLAPGRQMVHQ